MKISMFSNTFLPHIGGVARSVSTCAEDLIKRGHLVQIIAPTFSGVGKEKEKNVVRVPAIQNFNGSDFSVRIPFPGLISEAIIAFKPDLIHSHHPFLLGDAALRLSRTLRLPLVFTHHTLYEQYTHYVPLDSRPLKRFVIELATGYANLCNQVIAPSTSVKKLLFSRGVRSDICVLPTGVDIDFFSRGDGRRFRAAHHIADQTMVIGHVGRLAREKNLPYLAEAVAKTVSEKEAGCFLVAGKGDAEPEIRKIFEQQGLADRLIMVGNLSGQALADCYAAMDVFAFASHSETQGLVLAEAMAAATPAVALHASGVDDVVKHDVNGILLAADATKEEFAAALLAALNDPGKLQSWQDNTAETAKEFSRDSSADRLAALYQDTIRDRTPPHSAETSPIDTAITAIKTEWELLQKKTMAAFHSFTENQQE